MLQKYPRTIVIRDDREIILRPMEVGDGEGLWQFFQRIPEEDRIYFKDDVRSRDTIDRWEEHLDYRKVLPILALDGDRIVGDATLHMRRRGWKSKVGDVRVVIDREYRNRGLGTALIRELKSFAAGTPLDYLVAELVADQRAALEAFHKMGFEKAAHFKGFVTDWSGKTHDLMVLLYPLEDISEIFY